MKWLVGRSVGRSIDRSESIVWVGGLVGWFGWLVGWVGWVGLVGWLVGSKLLPRRVCLKENRD